MHKPRPQEGFVFEEEQPTKLQDPACAARCRDKPTCSCIEGCAWKATYLAALRAEQVPVNLSKMPKTSYSDFLLTSDSQEHHSPPQAHTQPGVHGDILRLHLLDSFSLLRPLLNVLCQENLLSKYSGPTAPTSRRPSPSFVSPCSSASLSLPLFCFLTPPLQYLLVGIEALQDLKLVEFTSGKPSSGQYDCQLPQQRAVL